MNTKYFYKQNQRPQTYERIKDLELYSLERRRERFLIINAWQQLEEVREERKIKMYNVDNNNKYSQLLVINQYI